MRNVGQEQAGDPSAPIAPAPDGPALLAELREWAAAAGFSQIGVADVDLSHAEAGLLAWLHNGFHGEMDYMAAHGSRRARPAELVPGTLRVVSLRMDYLPRAMREGSAEPEDVEPAAGSSEPAGAARALPIEARARTVGVASERIDHPESDDWRDTEWRRLADPTAATVSLYARGRDYHKVLRGRLQKLAERLAARVGPFGHRVFTDSAPVLEVELASRSGVGWRGKHTLALARDAGSMFFLGEIFVDLPLPVTPPVDPHCGSCRACLDVCPTRAIVAPYRLDARRCISYLTIEHAGPIPDEFRAPIGNRIYGCDDCQLVCPWNKFARQSALPDFDVRSAFGDATLAALWQWTEADFLRSTEGSAIRRIGFERWRRNLAVGIGNALRARDDGSLRGMVADARQAASPLVREHIDWALQAGPGSDWPLQV